MARVSPKAIEQFHEKLVEFKRSTNTSVSVRDVVAKSIRNIEDARRLGATWDQIAQFLSESFEECDSSVSITGKTLQSVYSKIVKERRSRKDTSDRPRQSRKRSRLPESAQQPEDTVDPGDLSVDQTDADSPASAGNETREEEIWGDSQWLAETPLPEELASASPLEGKRSRFNFNTVRPPT